MTQSYSSRTQRVFHTLHTVARYAVALAGISTLAACSSSDSDPSDPIVTTGTYGFAVVVGEDGAGRVDRISLSDGNTVNGSYPATGSDIRVTTDDTNLYQIGRFQIDSLTRFDAGDTSITDYQLTVNDAPDSDGLTSPANPYSLAFVNESKAYLTRYGSTELWIIDPRGESETPFKTGEIDLSAYDADVPNMSDSLIVGDKLFVLMERLTTWIPDKSAYVAVFDITTDLEIETNQSDSDLLGIELPVRNPTALQYNAATGEIYVVGRGNIYSNSSVTDDFHSGGIVVIDPDTYETELLVDDGTDADNQGYFADAQIISASLGYLLTYESYQVTTLRAFNPITGVVSDDVIAGLQDVDITVLAQGPDNHLWVGVNGETNGFYRIDLATGLIAEEIVATGLRPIDLTFINLAAQ
ncbi:MAG: hypothetical protein ACI9UN_001516 [Granulosicoccus sp.]|jgi:hypothetical protein